MPPVLKFKPGYHLLNEFYKTEVLPKRMDYQML